MYSAPQSVPKASTGQDVKRRAVTTVMGQVTSVISGMDVVPWVVSRDSSLQHVMMVRSMTSVYCYRLFIKIVALVLTEVNSVKKKKSRIVPFEHDIFHYSKSTYFNSF